MLTCRAPDDLDAIEFDAALCLDGIGFVTTGRTKRGLGLRSIDERVRLAGGEVTMESRPGAGTRLVVTVPVAALATELIQGV